MNCHWCDCEMSTPVADSRNRQSDEMSVDHVIPIAFYRRGILNKEVTPMRFVLCCYKCNQKHSRITSDILQLRDLLYVFSRNCTFQAINHERRCITRLGPHFLEWNH